MHSTVSRRPGKCAPPGILGSQTEQPMDSSRPASPRTLSIRARLLLLVLAVWLPAVVGFGMLARATYVSETRASQERISQLGDSLSGLIERELDKRAVMAMTLAASNAVKMRDVAHFLEEAAAATQPTGDWAFLFSSDKHWATTGQHLAATTLPVRRDTSSSAQALSVHFSLPSAPDSKPSLVMSVPEANRTPTELYVGVGFQPAIFQELLAHHELPDASIAAVIDGDLRVVARSRDPQKWLGAHATGDLNRRARAKEYGFGESTTLDGVPSLAYLTHPNKYDWSVVVAFPKSAMDRSARRVTAQALAASGVLLLLGLGLAFVVARSISAPIDTLRRRAAELSEKHVPSNQPTGLLEADVVISALHQAGLDAKAATQTLETRVAQAVKEAREAQATLLEARKHEAIGRLTGGLAHDFNNLLQTISTALHILDRTATAGSQRRVVESAMRAAFKATDLVKQMLAFGRTQKLEPRPVMLADFVLKNLELTQKAVGERITLTAHINPDLPALFVDPTQLELALLNLIFNARDAMPEGGNISITGRTLDAREHGLLGPGPFLILEVSDDGHGIEEGILEKVFEPYFTTKPVGSGSGLGLAQAAAFARQSGGDIGIYSQVGVGTTVRMILPALVATPSAPVANISIARPRIAEHLEVLMVEDDVLIASVVVPALEGCGHKVTLCSSADAAVPLLESSQYFDVLFTDVVMPGTMTGLDLVEWCRKHRPQLPTVVATGYSSQTSGTVSNKLNKPYAINDLVAALQGAVDPQPRYEDAGTNSEPIEGGPGPS